VDFPSHADNVLKHMDAREMNEFEADQDTEKADERNYGTGKKNRNAPKRDFTKAQSLLNDRCNCTLSFTQTIRLRHGRVVGQ
jgi:hypothetical protein